MFIKIDRLQNLYLSLPFLFLAFLCHIRWLSIALQNDIFLNTTYKRYHEETHMYMILYNHKAQLSIGHSPYTGFSVCTCWEVPKPLLHNKSVCCDYVDKDQVNELYMYTLFIFRGFITCIINDPREGLRVKTY